MTSPASESCSVRCGIGVGSGAGVTGLDGTWAAAATAAGFREPAATMPGVTSGMASVAFSAADAAAEPQWGGPGAP